jgi:hypothetical protein
MSGDFAFVNDRVAVKIWQGGPGSLWWKLWDRDALKDRLGEQRSLGTAIRPPQLLPSHSWPTHQLPMSLASIRPILLIPPVLAAFDDPCSIRLRMSFISS